jgi:hypothetical protein
MVAGQMSGWTLFPHFIVRTTGFPWELLERLRCVRSGGLARQALRAEAALESFKRDAPRLRHPSRAVLAALKGMRPVPVDQVEDPSLFVEWNRHAEELRQAREQFESVFAEELTAAQAALRDISEDARFREALASSSPPVYGDLARGRWSSRMERQLAAYVQRLCSKNETMSFFGPINYGVMDVRRPDSVELAWSGPLYLEGRRTHLAYWLIQGIAKAVAFDPKVAMWLVPRRKGFADPPMPKRRRRLGEILVERGTVTSAQLTRVLDRQSGRQQMLGELLVESGLVSQAELDEALKMQAAMAGALRDGEAADGAELLARLVKAANGAKDLKALAEELGASVLAVMEATRVACEKRMLTHQLELPAASPAPLQDLIERLSGVPGPGARSHLGSLAELASWMERYGHADASTKVQMNTELRQIVEERWGVRSPHEARQEQQQQQQASDGQPPAKQATAAHFYVDRLPMREECGGDLRMVVGGMRASELINRLVRPLELLGRSAENTRRLARQRMGTLLGKRQVPFWKVVAAFSDEPIPYDNSFSEWLTASVAEPTARRFVVDPAKLPEPPPADGLPLICSVDLLIGARDVASWARGEYELVMGDIHDTALVWGWALQFHENRAQVESEMIRAIGQLPRQIPVVTALASRRTGLLPAELPGPVIELGGVSVRPSAWRLPFDDLQVVSDGTTAHLYSTSLRSEVALYNGELESLVHTAFALPRIRPPRVDLGAHTPRIILDEVILQREQWQLTEAHVEALLACKDDAARLRCATRVWEELGLPEHVFAKLPGERKPVLVDPHSPLVLRSFVNLLEHRGKAVLSEMFPAPSQLWLSAPTGRHTAELRCTFLRGGSPA